MDRRIIISMLAILPLLLGQPQRKPRRTAKIEVVEIRAGRERKQITFDGKIRNSGTEPLGRLILLFDLLDADRKTISRRRGPIDQEILGPGEESEFHFYVPDHARAVEVQIAAEQRGMEIDVEKAGPYPID